MNREAWLKVLDHALLLRESILAAALPEEAGRHFQQSRKEALLGMKAVLDYSIERIGEREADRPPGKKTSRTVDITD
ncbi:hypothetical protein LJK88_10310 [Paenibacillus sp. P26]|nr:hypothetical protein LJK88_10310 [Paenibacillus sp. P26]UUZ89775.1 hypothetical protein LJK87_27355 [Paenibacillus sp. P25]